MMNHFPISQISASSALRVLMISEPGVDGVFRHVEALIHFLLRRGVEVDLAYSDLRAGPDLEDLISYVEAHNGRTLNLRVGNRPQCGDIRALVQLVRLVSERKPQVIHAHSSKGGVLGRSLRFLGVRGAYFYSPHAYFGMGRSGKSAALFNAIESLFACVGTTLLTSRSESLFAREKLGVSEQRLVIIPNGVDCKKFHPPTHVETRDLRVLLGIPQDAIVLGTVARYSHQKDPLTLHAVIRELLPKHENLWFVHLGKGELWDDVSALGAAHPRILRLPSFQSLADYYRALDGFALFSRYEGFSLAVLEALATGLPLVLSRAPGNRDFGSFGLNAIHWADAGNVNQLRQAIDDWLSNLHRPNNHREIVLKTLQDDKCFQRVLREYENALGVAPQYSETNRQAHCSP